MTDTTFRFRPFHIGTTHQAGPDSADPTIEICEFETFGEHTRRYVVAHVFTDETDAALIAAAPELYEALEKIAEFKGSSDKVVLLIQGDAIRELANAALAKTVVNDG